MTTQQFTNTVQFWERIKMFAENVEVYDAPGFEEKQMIVNVASEMAAHHAKHEKIPEERMVEIFNNICAKYGLNPEDVRLHNKSRIRDYVEIRQLCFYAWNREGLKVSLSKAGRFFGKDHATAIYGIRNIKNLRKYDSEFRQKTESILA